MPERIFLIVPCYNEATRLDFSRFQAAPDGVSCVFVDDGSRDSTADLIRRHESERLRLVVLEKNSGKGEAIRQGYHQAVSRGWFAPADWIGYWDADLATPLGEVRTLLSAASLDERPVDAVLGSRIKKLGSHVVRSRQRHVLGRMFTTVASGVLGLDCYDSQCGAKLFRPDAAALAFRDPFVSRWIFDIEILARLRGRHVIECPLREWADVRGSKLSALRIAIPTMRDLLRIRQRYGRT